MDIEQRKYIRFSVQENTFAALGSKFGTVGRVNDISIRGLTLSYLCGNTTAGLDRDFSQVYIFLSGDNFYLPEVHCKIVYDIQHPKCDKNGSIIKRRCGLHFDKLSKNQSELLELLLKNYTTEALLS
jgi:hypothetical protein